MHLVMFDIDGTLVDSAGFDCELYVEAVRSVLTSRASGWSMSRLRLEWRGG